MKTVLAVALFGGICLAAPSASADASSGSTVSSARNGSYVYRFDDDRLLGEERDPCRPRFPRRGARDRLVRPRISFVQELLKSVENM